MAKKILEVALQGAAVRFDGDKRSGEVGDNILIATQDFNKIIYVCQKDPVSSKPHWRTRLDRKIVVRKGSSNGWVKIACRVYAED